MNPVSSIARHGGVASLVELKKDGVSNAARVAALRSGQIARVRNGWFSVRGADPDLVTACRVGGRLTCASYLKSRGLWMMPDDRVHIAVPNNASRLRSPDDRRLPLQPGDPRVAVHWNQFAWAPPRNEAIDTLAAAIGHLIMCASPINALVTIDSALNRKLITTSQLRAVVANLPGDRSWILANADGRAQSGLETLARCGLRRHRVRVRIQVAIDRVGTVDCLIGDRLILELDSRAHHLGDNYEKDRTRDLHAIEQGYLVLRVSYNRVMNDWASVERVVLSLVRRGDHEWRGAQRRARLDVT